MNKLTGKLKLTWIIASIIFSLFFLFFMLPILMSTIHFESRAMVIGLEIIFTPHTVFVGVIAAILSFLPRWMLGIVIIFSSFIASLIYLRIIIGMFRLNHKYCTMIDCKIKKLIKKNK